MPAALRDCSSDEEIFDYLQQLLEKRVPSSLHKNLDDFVAVLRTQTPGIRAMVATYQLDISLTLDDLGWHFANWHHLDYCQETAIGLRELEATEAADIFQEALQATMPYWDQIGTLISEDFLRFIDWYNESDLEAALEPLNERMWAITEQIPDHSLFHFWVQYAKKYPGRVEG